MYILLCNLKLFVMMSRKFKETLEHRRSFYHIADSSPVSDENIREILEFALKHVPSAFNSQSTRLVLLLGDNHRKLWNITKDVLKERIVSTDAFSKTEAKIDTSFASGYGTVLFWEDMSIVRKLQKQFPTYKERFPIWAEQTSAMHQLVVWSMLEDVGFGASLQHYNPLIDKKVREQWGISEDWDLIAQMPFGSPVKSPDLKEYKSVDDRLLVF